MAGFCTTRWSLVMGARSASHSARRALDELCQIYRPPVLSYIRRRGRSAAEAEDLTQSFFERLLQHRTHASADPNRGRFRVFLLVALKRFLQNQQAFEHAAKRGGGQAAASLEAQLDAGIEPADPDTPDAAFERAWARVVVQQAVARLQAEAEAAGKRELFVALQEFLLSTPEAAAYEQVALKLGMRRNTIAVAIHRLRHRLREMVREELAETVTESGELQQEIDALQGVLATRPEQTPVSA